jgi:hypothetical protein
VSHSKKENEMHASISDNNDGKGGYLPTTPLMVDVD